MRTESATLSKDKVLETKKPAIIDAAIRLFSEKGIKATTVRDIAREAGVAEGTLYRHWKGKEELAQELFYDNKKRFKEELEDALRGVSGTKNKLRRAIVAFYAFAQREPLLYKFLILSSHYELRMLLPRTPKPLEVIIGIVKEGIEAGELKKIELPFAGAIIVGAITKLSDFKRMGVIEKELEEYIDPVTEFLWEALKVK
ncbi:MAG: TetR/AcrR family transcriptional regulator [Candidatus Brocadiales bacterium]